MKRLLLLDTLHDDPHRHHGAEFFPLLLGMARERGWDGRWWVVAVPDDHMHVGGRFMVDLPAEALSVLVPELAAWPPDVLVLPYRPTEALRRALAEAAPSARVVNLTHVMPDGHGGFARMITDHPQSMVDQWVLGAPQPAPAARLGPGPLVGDAEPAYGRRWLGPGPPPASIHTTRVAVEPGCSYHRAPSENPVYASLDAECVASWRGCAFCSKRIGDDQPGPRFQRPAVERALAQIRAHQRDEPARGERTTYVFDYGPVSSRFGALLGAALESPLAPSTFVTMLRADDLVAWRSTWEDLLPRLREAGHRFALISVGAENFSEPENARFNKGVTAEQLWECVDMLSELEQRYPDVFESRDPGYFSAILFTPWTTPDDLRANVEAARRLGAGWLTRALGTRLQLWEGTPIAALARRDGLLATDWFPDAPRIVATSAAAPSDRELPWRFADARTAALHRLLIRLAPLSPKVALDPDDPLREAVAAARATLPRALSADHVRLVGALIDAVDALGPAAPVTDLVDHCRTHAPEAAEPQPTAEDGGEAELEFRVGPPAEREPCYVFRVFQHRDGRPCYRRVGALALEYGSHGLDEPARVFAAVLERAMTRLADAPLSPEALPRWRQTVASVLDGAGLSHQFAWRAESGRQQRA